MNAKKSILIYFDNYPMFVSLPPEQRGWVVTALMVYGSRLSQEEITLEEVMDQFLQLSPEARLVCGFMGANILRDTRKWLSRQQREQAVRSFPAQNRPKRGAPPPLTSEERAAADRKAVEDMERMRRLMEDLRKKEQDA